MILEYYVIHKRLLEKRSPEFKDEEQKMDDESFINIHTSQR